MAQRLSRPKLSPLSCIAALTASPVGHDSQQLQAEISSLSSQLEESRDEAELNLLMLQQVLVGGEAFASVLAEVETILPGR